MKRIGFLLTFFIVNSLNAQISSPGLGDTNAASWLALGLKQNLNNKGTFESMSYVGHGMISNDDDYALMSKPAIVVLNQEFSNKLSNHWKLSYAISYRNQKNYEVDKLSNTEYSETQQEFRLYTRIAYITQIGKLKLTQTARQEIRRFVDSDWNNADKPLELRSRIKTQAALTLDKEKQHTLTAGAEMLFTTSKNNETKKWSSLKYNESRFTMAYTYRLKKLPMALSLGYMNNLIEKNKTHSAHYASFDVVIENPFSFFK